MKKINLNIVMDFVQPNELTPADRALVEKAIEATNNSYAKYSHFYVGAALRLEDGQIVIGANQENAAFPSGLCAERTAVSPLRPSILNLPPPRLPLLPATTTA